MQATLADYPAVRTSLDELAEEHGDLDVMTLDDFCEGNPAGSPLLRAAVRHNGSSAGWFLANRGEEHVWMIRPEGEAVEITDLLP